ncbi:hypothetical protein EI94DRAFT_1700154 [Lactarius quietus]|nr:hypothetical protein EI94DRAFT_1700154 [Lactarius quietus]
MPTGRSEGQPTRFVLRLVRAGRPTLHSLHGNSFDWDYDEAIALLETILDPGQPGECLESIRQLASVLSTLLQHAKSAFFQRPEHFEVAISHLRTELSSPPVNEGLRLRIAEGLALQTRLRFTQYGLDDSLEEANSYTAQVVDLSLSERPEQPGELYLESEAVRESYSMTKMAEKIRHLEELLAGTPPGTERRKEYLIRLANWFESKYIRTNEISDLDQSLKYGRLSLDATRSSDPWRINPFGSLCNILNLAYEKTGKIDYLDESIAVGYDILKLKSAEYIHCHATQVLVKSLLTREQLLGRRDDLHEAIQLMSMATDDQYVQEPLRFQLSCQWALVARSIDHSTTLTAYESAMSLMQKSLSFAPTVSIQHARLVAIGENCHDEMGAVRKNLAHQRK